MNALIYTDVLLYQHRFESLTLSEISPTAALLSLTSDHLPHPELALIATFTESSRPCSIIP